MVILYFLAETVIYLREKRRPQDPDALLSDDEAAPLKLDD
jgi:hypothetical protein